MMVWDQESSVVSQALTITDSCSLKLNIATEAMLLSMALPSEPRMPRKRECLQEVWLRQFFMGQINLQPSSICGEISTKS